MKLFKTISALAVAAAVLCWPAPARAQYDIYHGTRTTLMAAPTAQVITDAVNDYTNSAVDKIGYTGIGTITLIAVTNGSTGAAITATIQTSADSTNWTDLSNYGLVSSTTTINYTNGLGGTNLIASNSVLLPYTWTVPSVAAAGWATPYPVWSPFTNTGAITVTASGAFLVGLNLDDCARYVHVKWHMTGSATNHYTVVGALLNGIRNPGP